MFDTTGSQEKNDVRLSQRVQCQKIFFNLLEKFHESDSDTAAITGFKTKQN